MMKQFEEIRLSDAELYMKFKDHTLEIKHRLETSGTTTAAAQVSSLTSDGGVDVVLFNQQITRTFWKPWQQHQLDKCWDNHQGEKQGPVFLLSIKAMAEKQSFLILSLDTK